LGEGNSDERPVHNVCISAFEMDVHEVTNAEYEDCVDEGACTSPDFYFSITRPYLLRGPCYDDFPVIYVDCTKAENYCTWREAASQGGGVGVCGKRRLGREGVPLGE